MASKPATPAKAKPTTEQVFKELSAKLPFGASEADRDARKKLWSLFDVNGNNLLSLAEVDKGVKEMNLPALFDLKPVLMRAFTAARSKGPKTTSNADDYVSPGEFRYLLAFLRQYYELWLMFDAVDADDDRRISKAEFEAAKDKLVKWGMAASGDHWAAIDANGGGVVLFDEFCEWAIKQKLDHDQDDDAPTVQ